MDQPIVLVIGALLGGGLLGFAAGAAWASRAVAAPAPAAPALPPAAPERPAPVPQDRWL